MTTDLKLPTLYIIATDFGDLGIGSGDPATTEEEAYTAYADQVLDGCPSRVFVLEFCVATNAPETTREITNDFRDRLKDECETREIDFPEAA